MDNKSSKKGFSAWWKAHKPSKRRLIQLYAALLTNANIKGFSSGSIYKGETKRMCVPGLNCYSCPGAVGACPLGSLQNALSEAKISSLAYIFGILVLFGLILGRTVCGFFCPFGLIQELLHKIPSPKLKKNRFTRALSYLKYVILVLFVVIIPLVFSGIMAVPGFCKYICPSGTLLGAIGLLSNKNNAELFPMLGSLFTWKFCLLVIFVFASIFIFRFFCRFFCPLGAIYGFFSKVALLGIKLDSDKCTSCGLCVRNCKMDIRHVGDRECISCGDCISVCPTKAISMKGSQILLHCNETGGGTDDDGDKISGKVNDFAEKTQKRRKAVKVVPLVLAALLLVGALVYYNVIDSDTSSKPVYEEGVHCPEIMLPGIADDPDFTLSQHRGKVVVINFWATWCGPCVAELPQFEKLANEYSEDVYVVAVHVTEYTEGFIEEKGWDGATTDFVQDTEQTLLQGQMASEMFGSADALPITVIIGRDGKIISRCVGSVTYDMLVKAIEPELE